MGPNKRARERAAARAAEASKRAEAERKAIADAQKIIATWNARQAAEPCDSRRAITNKLPARQHGANFSSPNDRHNFGTVENVTENRKQILEVRWLAPDPNDHSKLIEPEPD